MAINFPDQIYSRLPHRSVFFWVVLLSLLCIWANSWLGLVAHCWSRMPKEVKKKKTQTCLWVLIIFFREQFVLVYYSKLFPKHPITFLFLVLNSVTVISMSLCGSYLTLQHFHQGEPLIKGKASKIQFSLTEVPLQSVILLIKQFHNEQNWSNV